MTIINSTLENLTVSLFERGEVNISQYQLDSFLQTAEALKIKGKQREAISIFTVLHIDVVVIHSLELF